MKKTKRRILSMMILASVINFVGTGVSASNSYEFSELEMTTSGGSDISLYENSNYTKELDQDDIENEYYTRLSANKSKIKINASSDEGVIKISKNHSNKEYDVDDNIPILVGKTTLYVKIYENEEDAEENNKAKEQCKIKIFRYSREEEEEILNDDQDDIYLQEMELDYGDVPLKFRRDKMDYDVNVDKDMKSLMVKAMPEDGAYTVRINGITVDENDDYKKNVNLSEGRTKVEVEVSYDDDEKREYNLYITRNGTVSQDENTTIKEEDSNTNSENVQQKEESDKQEIEKSEIDTDTSVELDSQKRGWMKKNGTWMYKDDYGNPIKNGWFIDRNNKKAYYFDNVGVMKTGWIMWQNKWYYLDYDGSMATGWKQINSDWYYLNYDGSMVTGWLKNYDGKYYYFYDGSGKMAFNTKIGNYRLDNNGVWVR